MQEALGYPDNHEQHDDTIIILLDPDQILVRPFTKDFTNSSEKWRLKEGYKLKIEHGSPFSQQYGYGLQWKRKVDPEQVFQGHSLIADMSDKEAMDYYIGMGPPYVATGKDMYTIVSTWADIVPRVHNDYPHLLAGECSPFEDCIIIICYAQYLPRLDARDGKYPRSDKRNTALMEITASVGTHRLHVTFRF